MLREICLVEKGYNLYLSYRLIFMTYWVPHMWPVMWLLLIFHVVTYFCSMFIVQNYRTIQLHCFLCLRSKEFLVKKKDTDIYCIHKYIFVINVISFRMLIFSFVNIMCVQCFLCCVFCFVCFLVFLTFIMYVENRLNNIIRRMHATLRSKRR